MVSLFIHLEFCQVTLSSLNRHAVATREDVGSPKAICLEKHFKRILPEVRVALGMQAAVPYYLKYTQQYMMR